MSKFTARWCHLLPALLATLTLASFAAAQPCHRWEVTGWLLTPDCGSSGPFVRSLRGMNRHGDIVGGQWCAFTAPNPFLIRDGEFMLLEHPDVTSGFALDVDDEGRVVGQVYNSRIGKNLAFVWHAGEWTFIEPDDGGGDIQVLEMLNESGVAVGVAEYPASEASSAIIRYDLESGSVERVGETITRSTTGVSYVDAEGRFAGFINYGLQGSVPLVEWERGEVVQVPLPLRVDRTNTPASDAGVAMFDTDMGIAVGFIGWRVGPTTRRAGAVWHRNSGFRLLATPPGGTSAFLSGIIGPDFLLGSVKTAGLCSRTVWIAGEPVGLESLVDAPFEIQSEGIGALRPATNGSIALSGSIRLDGHAEFQRAIFWADMRPASPGDMNCDGVIDFDDVERLLAHWGPCPDRAVPSGNEPQTDACGHDLNGDGEVSNRDLLILFENWSG